MRINQDSCVTTTAGYTDITSGVGNANPPEVNNTWSI